MFLKGDIFEKLLCCRRKVKDIDNEDKVEEEIVLQHTNNNKTEYITSSQLLERLKGGTTAVVALVREKRLVVAWLGDSLALLVRKRTPVHIVQPHKPEAPSEKKRIEDIGGVVVNIHGTWRVLGQLAVSRAIGDVSYKPYVTSECDIKSLEICGDEDFLILACDGLWDNLSPETAVNIVYAYLLKNNGDTDGVGRSLVETARSSGSEDNITAVVVFLRPVSVLMEEETARISQGQVPEAAESFVMTQKDALPPSFNAIFSPPENYNHLSKNIPSEAVRNILKEGNGMEDIPDVAYLPPPVPEPLINPGGNEYDSDEGVGIDIDISLEKSKEEDYEAEDREVVGQEDNEIDPSHEEVVAALAELDSIPDGETGELDDEDEEEEEWSYYKMEHQGEQYQNEEIYSETSKGCNDKKDIESEQSPPPPQSSPIPVVAKDRSPSASPSAPSSPRTVEGFVTSVELNTPEESYNTNLAINQSTEYFNGGQIEQNSGPFSVYVSSSPEPASIETPPINLHSPMPSAQSPSEFEEAFQREEPKAEVEVGGASVEIVHAQSTVEVMSEIPAEVEVHSPGENPFMEDISPIPDIMTQSFTGTELPTEPYVDRPPFMEFSQKPFEEIPEYINDDDNEDDNIVDHFASGQVELPNDENIEEVNVSPNVTCSPVCIDISGGQLETSNVNAFDEFEENIHSEEPSPYFLPRDQIPETSALLDVSEHVSSHAIDEVSSKTQLQFTEGVNKAFEEPLDPMMTLFHEDGANLVDINPPEVPPTVPEVELESEPLEESPVAVAELADQLSQIQVNEEKEEIPDVCEVAAKVEPKRPVSAPRTTVAKSGPPKPSPRTVESKLTANKLSAANAPSLPSTSPAGAKPTPKRPSTLGSGTKLIKKTETTKTSTPAAAATNRGRVTSMTSRTSSLQAPRPSTAPATSTTKAPTSGLKAKSTTPLLKPKSVAQTGASLPKTTTSLTTKTKPPTTTTTTSKSRLATSSTNTMATKRLTTTTRPLSSSTTTTSRIGSATGVPNGVAPSTKTTKTTTTRTSLGAAATKKPLAAKTSTTTTTTRVSSAPVTNKAPASSNRTSTISSLKPKSITTAPPSTKETKNTTNRMLSTNTRTSATKIGSQTTTKTSTTTTTMATKSRLNTRTTKTPGLRSKKEPGKALSAAPMDSEATNGENKIVEEESSVEVKEKLVEEERSEITTDHLIDITASKVEAVVSVTPENILVNGDH